LCVWSDVPPKCLDWFYFTWGNDWRFPPLNVDEQYWVLGLPTILSFLHIYIFLH
jgi:hypothetical protein